MPAGKDARTDVGLIENPQIQPPEDGLHCGKVLAREGDARRLGREMRQQRVGRQRAEQEREEEIVEAIAFVTEVEAGNDQRQNRVENR